MFNRTSLFVRTLWQARMKRRRLPTRLCKLFFFAFVTDEKRLCSNKMIFMFLKFLPFSVDFFYILELGALLTQLAGQLLLVMRKLRPRYQNAVKEILLKSVF